MNPLSAPALRAPSPAPTLPASVQGPGKLRETAQAFETAFLTTMLNSMMDGLGDDPLTGGGQAGETYRAMLNEEYAKTISGTGGIGIADQIMRELIKAQENAQ
jgi:flagellar protein FlgJ